MLLPMDETQLIDRGEVTGMLWAIADINANILVIRRILEEDGGEEGLPEADA